MKVQFRCNLDNVMRKETWPLELPECPRVGDLIRSANVATLCGDPNTVGYGVKVQLELAVVGVTWSPVKTERPGWHGWEWIPVIELHLPPYGFKNILEFQTWYEKLG